MKMQSVILVFIILFMPFQTFCEIKGPGEQYIVSDTLGRIGFLNEFSPRGADPVDDVVIGIEVSGNVLFKLTTFDGEINVSVGMLSPGINSIRIPVIHITGENKGVFSLYLKEGEAITRKQVVIIPDRYEIIEKPDGNKSGDAVNDRYRHEITVTGEDNRYNDYASRIVMDSISGNYPALTQGIPVLPILYLLGNKIYRTLKKRKKRVFPLYSQSELYTEKGQKNGEYARISLRILINDV